jgi:DNA replication ATP-dependent helicase Dna2
VITPYRSQVRALSIMLNAHPDIEVFTVDRYQGRDKDCIIVSTVRNTVEQNVSVVLFSSNQSNK